MHDTCPALRAALSGDLEACREEKGRMNVIMLLNGEEEIDEHLNTAYLLFLQFF